MATPGHIWIQGTSIGVVLANGTIKGGQGDATGGTGTPGYVWTGTGPDGGNEYLYYTDQNGAVRRISISVHDHGSGTGSVPGQIWNEGNNIRFVGASGRVVTWSRTTATVSGHSNHSNHSNSHGNASHSPCGHSNSHGNAWPHSNSIHHSDYSDTF